MISISQDVYLFPWPLPIPTGLNSLTPLHGTLDSGHPGTRGKNDFIRDKSMIVGEGGKEKRSSCLRNQKIDLGFQSF